MSKPVESDFQNPYAEKGFPDSAEIVRPKKTEKVYYKKSCQ